MATREAHLVGSLPGSTAAEAMGTALEILGPFLRSLPDGETGERRNWVLSIVEQLRTHPDLELQREGDWSDYDKTPRFRVRRGHRLLGATLDLGHVAAVHESFPAFEKVRAATGREDLAFQQGVPSDLDLAMFSLGAPGALRYRRAFTEATLAEVREIAAITGPDTLFQIEMPAELVLLARAPAAARPLLARLLARGLAQLAAGAPPGTRFALHLCLGDMNNRAFGTMGDVGPLVVLANALMAAWPADRPLELIHAPFAAADHPATTESAFYAPLNQLKLPASVRFAAGFVHEAQPLEDQVRIRTIIEEHLGQTVVIASACGLGRRTDEAARLVLERTAELCAD
jgi:hypothetical protein